MNTLLLAVLAACAVILTTLSLVNFVQLQRTLCEIRQTAGTARTLLLPAQRAVQEMENLVHRACGTALRVLEKLSFLGKKRGIRPGPRTRRHG